MNILHKMLASLNKKNNNLPELHSTSTLPTYNQCNDCYNILKQQKETEALVSEVNTKIDKVNELATILNKSTNREEFFNSMTEIEKILTELLNYEYMLDFSYPPSAHLKDFKNSKNKRINLLEKRIAQKKKEIELKNTEISKTKKEITCSIEKKDVVKKEQPKTNNRNTEILYHDKYDEEYQEAQNYRTIQFMEKEGFDIPEVQICAAILLSASQYGSQIRSNKSYSLYFEGRYGIINISRLHQWLYEQGYLRTAMLQEALNRYKVTELKNVLESLGLKKSGNKSDLIDRIIGNINDEEGNNIANKCEYLFLTDKGHTFLQENEDYVMYHSKSYSVSFEEFNRHRILQGRKRKFYDTIFQALNERAFLYQYKHYYSRLEMIYFYISEVLYDEGKYDLALRYTLYRLYFSTNLARHTNLFDIELVKINGIEAEKEYIKAYHDEFNRYAMNRIVELKEYYRESILDIIYGEHILPYTIFNKSDLADAIHNLLNEIYFDEEPYINRICIKYESYIKQFL